MDSTLVLIRLLPQQLVNGLTIGAVYALVALGYTMVYGVLQLINFAHGDLFMLGRWWRCSWWRGSRSLSPWPSASAS